MEIPNKVLESKEYKKAEDEMGKQAAQEFCRKLDNDLKDVLSANAIHEQEVKESVEASSEYQKASETLKLFKTSMRERLKSTKITTNLAKLILCDRKNGQ